MFARIKRSPLVYINLLGVVLICAFSQAATAQERYPSKPIKLIVPFSAGGGTDALGRALASKMSERLGQPVVVENVTGASTMIGASRVAKAAPDGYTLLMTTTTTFSTNPHTFKEKTFSIDDFIGISLVSRNPLVLAAPASAPYNTPAELVAYAKASPDALSYGTQGRGGTAHFVGEMIASALGIKMVDVPYPGSAPGLAHLAGGQIPLLVDGTVASLPLVRGGKIKLIAVTSSRRIKAAPSVPTFVESGYPEMVADFKTAVLAPAKTPGAVVAQLNSVLREILSEKELEERYAANGTILESSTPEELIQLFKLEHARYGKLIKSMNLEIN
jgi:tripartite-type tricarboxylate transporter receptor subunit TctC